MRTMKCRMMLVAGSAAMVLAAAGCAGNTAGGARGEGSANSVAIDVGNDMTVNLPRDRPLRIAYFLPSVVNDYGLTQKRAAEEMAQKLGVEITMFDAAFDPSRQLNQMQTALQSAHFDAALVSAVDGSTVCKTATDAYPKANVLVVAVGSPLCGLGPEQTGESLEEVWAPGTLNFVGSTISRAYVDGWFAAAAKANPGRQRVGVVMGLPIQEQTRVIELALKEFAANNSDYTVEPIHTDYTTADAYNKTQTYLQGHPDTTLLLSAYSPDISQGVIQAVKEAGLQGQIKIVDQGFGDFMIEQIEAGTVQLSTLLNPYNMSKVALESVVAAQSGDAVPRFADDSVIGTVKDPFTVTKETISDLPAELR
jgi:ribose transport system substrate-binding protein